MAPKRFVNRLICWELYKRHKSYRKVAVVLAEMGVVSPYTGRPPSHMAVKDAIQSYKQEYGDVAVSDRATEEAGDTPSLDA